MEVLEEAFATTPTPSSSTVGLTSANITVELLDASTRSVYLMLAHPPEDQIQPVKDQRTGCDDLSHVGQGCPRRFDNQESYHQTGAREKPQLLLSGVLRYSSV